VPKREPPLHARDNRLVAAYNAQVTAHNSLIARNCTQAN